MGLTVTVCLDHPDQDAAKAVFTAVSRAFRTDFQGEVGEYPTGELDQATVRVDPGHRIGSELAPLAPTGTTAVLATIRDEHDDQDRETRTVDAPAANFDVERRGRTPEQGMSLYIDTTRRPSGGSS